MESLNLLGVQEECSSSESGWTMYIASTTHEDENYHDDYDADDDENMKHGGGYGDGDDRSDDSMLSDASSRPRYHAINCGGHGMGCFKHGRHMEKQKKTKKNVEKQEKKRDENAAKISKVKSFRKAKSTSTHSQTM